MPAYSSLERVSLSAIDFADDSYRVSRKRPLDALRSSIERFGVLESPLLLGQNDRIIPVFGHNRILAAAESGLDSVNAVVVDRVDPTDYRNRALLKCARNEAGPVGRIKMALVLNRLGTGADDLRRTMRYGLGVPDEFASARMLDSVLGLPGRLRDYLDARDVGFKVIKELVTLPTEAQVFLGERAGDMGFRINIFREIVEMLSDIAVREGTLEPVLAIPPAQTGDRRRDEQALFDAIYALRYPSYAAMREKAAKIVSGIERAGCGVTFPPYFEGGEVTLNVRFVRGEREESIRKRLSEVDARGIEKLLDLL